MGGNQGPSRRAGTFAAVVAALLLALAVSAPVAGAAPLFWALNPTAGTLNSYSPVHDLVVGLPIPVGAGPSSIAITPDGRRAYVADSTAESVTVVELVTRIPIATIKVPGPPEQVAISSDGSLVYVTAGERLIVISTASNSVVQSIPVGPEVSAVAADAGLRGRLNELVYVGVGTEEVQAVNPTMGFLSGMPLKVGGRPTAIAFAPDGELAFVAAGNEVDVIDGGAVIKKIPLGGTASGLAVNPDGSRVYVTSASGNFLKTIATVADEIVGKAIPLFNEPKEIALSAGGGTAYVATSKGVIPVDLTTGAAPGVSIPMSPAGASGVVVSPDQLPIAAFEPPEAIEGVPTTFSAAPSTDPDGAIACYRWGFSNGGGAEGMVVTHTALTSESYFALLNVTDEEGCNGNEVFTGRTAYCAASNANSVTHRITVKPASICSARFAIGGVSHNRRNGTVRVRLRFPSTGSFLLFGKKIHAVTRKVRKPGATVVTLHARVELNKRLKKTLRASVRYRLTFTPSAGCGSKTVHRSVALLRAPRKKHRR